MKDSAVEPVDPPVSIEKFSVCPRPRKLVSAKLIETPTPFCTE